MGIYFLNNLTKTQGKVITPPTLCNIHFLILQWVSKQKPFQSRCKDTEVWIIIKTILTVYAHKK